MHLKDYYKILEVSPRASQQEIKQAYRKLAHLYHPDKNEGNRMAEAHFREIIEAYNILSDPKQRDSYNYQRWNQRKNGKKYNNLTFSPLVVLQEAISLREYMATVDIFRMNQDALNFQINEILSTHNITLLANHNNFAIDIDLIKEILIAAKSLDYKYAETVAEKLKIIAKDNNEAIEMIDKYIKQKRKAAFWNKYKIALILLVTILLCTMIYFFSKPL
ncbi:MAG: J domain-containing protein [Bacteroidetes bacterium]|nr:J domain-containing protein [Bacteroidota bacterium]